MNSKCFTLHLNCRSIFSEGLPHKKIRHVISDTAKRSLYGILILILCIKKTNLHTIMTCQSQFGALLSYQEFIFLFILALRAGEKGNTWVLLFFISFRLAGFKTRGSEGQLALFLLTEWESPATFLLWLEKLCLRGQEFNLSWYLTQIFLPLWQSIRALEHHTWEEKTPHLSDPLWMDFHKDLKCSVLGRGNQHSPLHLPFCHPPLQGGVHHFALSLPKSIWTNTSTRNLYRSLAGRLLSQMGSRRHSDMAPLK